MANKREPERRTVNLQFEVFGWRILGDRARETSGLVEDVIADACSYYVEASASDEPPPPVPRFKPSGGTAQETSLALPAETWATLESEAERAGVPLERLIEHAVFAYLGRTPPPETRRTAGPSAL